MNHYALKYPRNVTITQPDMLNDDVFINFEAQDERLTIVMTRRQAEQMLRGGIHLSRAEAFI